MKVITEADEEITLGTTETTPTISIVDYSRRETDDFGITTVVERGFARRLSVRLALSTADVDVVQLRLAELRASPARWIADDRFAWLNVEGFYKDFELDLATPSISYCTLTVEGLAETEVVADVGGDPAPIGSSSTLRLLQPITVTNSVLTSSNVPETDYAEWAAGTTYALGARVIKASAHRIYESAAAANIAHDPAAETGHWVDVGPTNRWAMFDQALGSLTSRASSIAVTLAPGVINAIALLDVTGTSVRVQAPGYDQTKPVGTGSVKFLDLPATGAAITVTVTGTGTVSIGTLLVGTLVSLGITAASPTAGITDFSRKDVDDFGEVTVVERAWSKRMTARALIRSDAVDVVANRIAAVRARPSLWIGDEDRDSLTVYGFFRDFSLEVGEGVSLLSLTIEGLSKAAPLGGPTFGADGLSIAEVMVFQRKAGAAPALPAGGSYDFFTKTLTPPAGWAVVPPAGTDPLYAARGTASIQGVTGSAAPTWAGVGKMAQDGAQGIDGAGVDVIFTRSAAQPATPAASAGIPVGWYSDAASVPASANPLWGSFGQRANSTSNYSWDTPARIEGATGATGAAGLSIAEVTVFQRKAGTAPALPTGGSYNFATKTLTPPASWAVAPPAGTDPLYAARGTASVQGITGSATPTWAGVGKIAQDGTTGIDGAGVDVIFTRSAAQPATPAASAGIPAGWYSDVASVPASANPLWGSFGQRANSMSNYTWDTPARVEGATGATGPTGPTFDVSAPTRMFTMVDGVLSPGSQSITLSATIAGVAAAVAWSIRQPNGTEIRVVASATSVAVTEADLGAHASLIVKASLGTASRTETLERENKLSAASLSTIAYNADNAKAADDTILNISADGVVDKAEKKKYLIPLWAEIQANYTKFQTEAAARGVTTEKTAHTTAYNSLSTYIASYSSMLDASKATAATADLRTYIQGYHTAEAALIAAMNAKAATTALWSATFDDNGKRPADGAGTSLALALFGPAGASLGPGNAVKLVSPSGSYNQGAYSVSRYYGGAFYEVIFATPNHCAVSFADDSAGTNNFGIWANIAGLTGSVAAVASDGVTILFQEPYSPTKRFSVLYVGPETIFYVNGNPVASSAAAARKSVLLRCVLNTVGTIADIQFAPAAIRPAIGSTLEDGAGVVRPASSYDNSAISMAADGSIVGAGGGKATYGGIGGKALGLLDAVDFESSYVTGKTRVGKLNSATGRATNSSILPSNVLYSNIPSLNDAVAISDTDNSGTVTINVGNAVFYPDSGGTVTFPSGGIPGCAYGTKYYIKRVGVTPATPTGTGWNASTTFSVGLDEVLINPSNYTTRASAAVPSPPPPPPREAECVAAEAWVETRNRGFVRARHIVAGDMLRVLTGDRTGTSWEACTNNHVARSEAVLIRTGNGFALTCSVTTPITLRDGSTILAPDAGGKALPVYGDRLRWSLCTVESAGTIEVAHIRCSQATYAAGDEPGRSILTHNPFKA